MDRQQHYPLFPPQLPPPSHLHLPPPHSSQSFRSNTLPPLSPLAAAGSARFPPASYHPSLSSVSSSASSSSPYASNPQPSWTHRTSSARDDVKPEKIQDMPPPQQPQDHHRTDPDDGMPPTSDFVKKLYKMLQDNSFSDVVCWGPAGDCFIIKDMTEFTKSILPRMFKHSNFASFVRQLNKYDFHKVKNNEENTFGDHSWTFRHPDFQADRRDALENIKRKVPSQRKPTGKAANSSTAAAASASSAAAAGAAVASPGSPAPTAESSASLQAQIDRLTRAQDDMAQHLRSLERNYQSVLAEMVHFQRNMAQQDGLMQNLIQYFLQLENGKKDDPAAHLPPTENQFVPASEAQRIMGGTYPESDIARASFEQMNEIARRASSAGMQFNPGATSPPSPAPSPLTRQDALQRIEELQRARPASAQDDRDPSSSQQQQQQPQPGPPAPFPDGSVPFPGLQVFTVGHLLPRSSAAPDDGTWSFDPSALQLTAPPAPGPSYAPPSKRAPTPQRLRVRRSTFVPGWAVPPRVLLVDDDAVSRKLSSKFLQVFGCTIDVAVDGVGAVNKMNLEKYDLVLMDIVMPKLDGVSATSLIRQFDPMTPIISMTSNSKPNEILTYYSHGMNDILPKPFTKEGLLDMLEKHLMHLKVIQEMAKVPRGPGIPPLNDSAFNEALVVGSQAQAAAQSSSSSSQVQSVSPLPLPPMSEDDARINPLAGLGLSDEQYAQILQNIVQGDTFGGGATLEDGSGGAGSSAGGTAGGSGKRALEDAAGSERGEKRSRFQVVE